MKTQHEMKGMMDVYQEINKRRQLEEMDVNSLTMFAEAWEYQKRIIDEQQKQIDDLVDMVKTSADSEMYLFDELQRVNKDRDELKRCINEALRCVVDHGGYDDLTHVINILKGKDND